MKLTAQMRCLAENIFPSYARAVDPQRKESGDACMEVLKLCAPPPKNYSQAESGEILQGRTIPTSAVKTQARERTGFILKNRVRDMRMELFLPGNPTLEISSRESLLEWAI